MEKIIPLYKPQGLTPLEAINKFKLKFPQYKDAKMSYAGRLDPLAKGILLLLINNENKKITKYLKLSKQYKAEILFNLSTDTYDVLGIPDQTKTPSNHKKQLQPTINQIKKQLKILQGNQQQTIPPYSSHIIKGKPLFWYARNNKLPKQLPTNNIKISKIKINKHSYRQQSTIIKEILKKISSLNPKADFRQTKITHAWKKILSPTNKTKYLILTLTIDCSSGTYIRQLANQLGKNLNTQALLYTLTRTKVGKFTSKKAIKI